MYWGCAPALPLENRACFTVITDGQGKPVYPSGTNNGLYILGPDFDEFADEFVFEPDTPYYVVENQEMRVYHTEGQIGVGVFDNEGEHCINVEVEYV